VQCVEGFHGSEEERGLTFRWMTRHGRLTLTAVSEGYIELWMRSPYADLSQHLEITIGAERHAVSFVHGWNTLSIPVSPGCDEIRLDIDKLFPVELHPGDGRELAVQVRPPSIHTDSVRHARMVEQHAAAVAHAREALESEASAATALVRFESGFYHDELEEGMPFRWMARAGRLGFAPAPEERFLELRVRSAFHDLSQSLLVRTETGDAVDYRLVFGWSAVSIAIPAGTGALDLTATRALPQGLHEGDPRDLTLRIRPPLLHRERARHESVERRQTNRVENLKDVIAGRDELRTTPPKLGIDVQGACNVKPPCVYCAWDWNKALEGDNVDVPFTASTLEAYGDFYENADELVNCSIGEPFMMREIDPLLDEFGQRGQVLELTTNGMILTERNIEKLLSRDVHLYISLDASTPETFAKLRNDSFLRILENVRRLVNAKGGPGHLPLVYLVFMPMKVNEHEVDDFVKLCAELRVDRLVLRPLNRNEGVDLESDRAGYHFDYAQEILPFPALVRISGRVARLCARLGVELSDQMDFGASLRQQFAAEYDAGKREGELLELAVAAPSSSHTARPIPEPAPPVAAPPPAVIELGATERHAESSDAKGVASPALAGGKLPLCTEPWTSLYILRRGIMPCCYGGRPLAPMGDFVQAWNGRQMRELRRELAAGRFHRYCFESPDCPIVQKSVEARDMPVGQKLRRRRLMLVEAAREGWPGRTYRLAKHYSRLAQGRVGRLVARSGA